MVARRLLLDILRHPWRFVALVTAVAFIGWLSGYDVR